MIFTLFLSFGNSNGQQTSLCKQLMHSIKLRKSEILKSFQFEDYVKKTKSDQTLLLFYLLLNSLSTDVDNIYIFAGKFLG